MPSDTPSDTPTDVPTDAPTDTPTDAPSDAPTDAPSTLGEITGFEQTHKSEAKVTFASAVPESEDLKISLSTNGGDVTVTPSFNEDRTVMTLVCASNFMASTYTVKVELGEEVKTADAEFEVSKPKEIALKSTTALTGSNGESGDAAVHYAYIYFDVVDQFGDSVQESANVQWTVTGGDSVEVDNATGRITVSNKTAFQYGSTLYVSGVYTAGSEVLTYNGPVTIGLAQSVANIKMKGFLDLKDKTTVLALNELPADFENNRYVLIYEVQDQQDCPMEATGNDISESNLTFISDAPLIISTTFTDAGVFTVKGIDYSGVNVTPGNYSDKGGESTITAVANKNGTKTPEVIKLKDGSALQSLKINEPSKIVCDGESVELKYTATDTNGNSITDYDTIVRSTNTLNISASEGTLTISENADGSAKITWADSDSKYTLANRFGQSSAWDGQDRMITLTAIVVGGDGSAITNLNVKDARRVAGVDYARLHYSNENVAIEGERIEQGINAYNFWWGNASASWAGDFIYTDQYGEKLDADVANQFLTTASTDFNGYIYGIRADVSEQTARLLAADKVVTMTGEYSFKLNPRCDEKESASVKTNDTIKYSVVRIAKADAAGAEAKDWQVVGKTYSKEALIAPVKDVVNGAYVEEHTNLMRIETSNSDRPNGKGIAGKLDATDGTEYVPASSGAIIAFKNQKYKTADDTNTDILAPYLFNVKSKVYGDTIIVPNSWVSQDEAKSAIAIDKEMQWGNTETLVMNGVVATGGALGLKWEDLYVNNGTTYERQNAKLPLAVSVAASGSAVTVSTKISVSDAAPYFASLSVGVNDGKDTPNSMAVNDIFKFTALDQYGDTITLDSSEFKITGTDEKDVQGLNRKFNSLKAEVQDGKVNVTGAEIGDSVSVQLTGVYGKTELTADGNVTFKADAQACMTDKANPDKTFRTDKDYLGMVH